MKTTLEKQPLVWWEGLIVAAITLLGLLLRAWTVTRVPGLWYDEAINGVDALRVLREDGLPIFFDTEGHVREPLFLYLEAVGIQFGGTTAAAIRGVSAVIGSLTIPVVWLLAREYRGRWFGLLAMVLFAFLRWHVTFSALAFRTILSPLFVALTFLFLFRLLRTRKWSDAILCGLFLGGGAYTYLAFRLMPFILMPPLLLALWQAWRSARSEGLALLKRIGGLVATAALVFSPLAIHFLQVPWHFTGRSDEVSFFQREDAGSLLLRQARDVGLMPLLRGDHVGKHNLPGPPQFLQLAEMRPDRVEEMWQIEHAMSRAEGTPAHDPHGTGLPVFGISAGLFFYLGFVLVAISALRDPRELAIISLLLVGSLASVLSYGAPNMLRLLMLAPAAVLLLARGYEQLAIWLWWTKESIWKSEMPESQRLWRHGALVGAAVGWLLVMHLETEMGRLLRWPSHPLVVREFNRELADIANFLRVQPDRLPVRLPFASQPTLEFLADGYAFNPEREELPERWWELRTVPPIQPIEPWGDPVPEGRSLTVIHPQGFLMGELVEVSK